MVIIRESVPYTDLMPAPRRFTTRLAARRAVRLAPCLAALAAAGALAASATCAYAQAPRSAGAPPYANAGTATGKASPNMAADPPHSPAPQALDAQLDCSSTGHDFVAPLIASGAIRSKPMRVEANSVNAFHTVRTLSAYGFSVFVVLGYQQGDPLLALGSGTPIAAWSYGVVVRGAPDEVEARARAAGSRATVVAALPLVPLLTAIVCKAP